MVIVKILIDYTRGRTMETKDIKINMNSICRGGSFLKSHKILNCTSKPLIMQDHLGCYYEIVVSTNNVNSKDVVIIQEYVGNVRSEVDEGLQIIIQEDELRLEPMYVEDVNCVIGYRETIERLPHPNTISDYTKMQRSEDRDAIVNSIGAELRYTLFVDPNKIDPILPIYYVQPENFSRPIQVKPEILTLDGDISMQLEIGEPRPVRSPSGELLFDEAQAGARTNLAHAMYQIEKWDATKESHLIELDKYRSFITLSGTEEECMNVTRDATIRIQSQYTSAAQANVCLQQDHDKAVKELKTKHTEDVSDLQTKLDEAAKKAESSRVEAELQTKKLEAKVQEADKLVSEYTTIIGDYKAKDDKEHAEKIAESKESVASSNSSGASAKASSVTWQAWAAMGATAVTVVGGVTLWVVKTSTVAAISAAGGITAATIAAVISGVIVAPHIVAKAVEVMSEIAGIAVECVKGVYDLVVEVVETVVDAIVDVANVVIDTVKTTARFVYDSVCEVADTVGSVISSGIDFVCGLFA